MNSGKEELLALPKASSRFFTGQQDSSLTSRHYTKWSKQGANTKPIGRKHSTGDNLKTCEIRFIEMFLSFANLEPKSEGLYFRPSPRLDFTLPGEKSCASVVNANSEVPGWSSERRAELSLPHLCHTGARTRLSYNPCKGTLHCYTY